MVNYPTSEQLQALRKAGKYHIVHSLVWELYDLGYEPKFISTLLEIKYLTVRGLTNKKKTANEDQLTAIPYTLEALEAYIDIIKDEGIPKETRKDLQSFITYINEVLANTIEREEIDEEMEREPNTPLQKIIQQVNDSLDPRARKKLKQTKLELF